MPPSRLILSAGLPSVGIWTPYYRTVLASQGRRRIVYDALRRGTYTSWDFLPFEPASRRYMRKHMDLNIVEASQRYPKDPTS